jgi:nitrite reductase/ring-hydroxylating ferredoxin subunit
MSAETRPGTIGIIGAGHIGQAFARVAQRAGREVLIANSRGPESLSPAVAALGDGVSAGTVAEAAASALVVIALPWANVPAAVEGLVWNGKIVIDATNAFVFADTPDYAFSDICTHRRCSLSEGELDSTTLECICHSSRFDVSTGDLLRGPAKRSVQVYAVRVQGDALVVDVPSAS